jgi:hypothetical protein
MHFCIILVPKYLAFVNFLCFVFLVLALPANIIFTVSVSKHLLIAEDKKSNRITQTWKILGGGPQTV